MPFACNVSECSRVCDANFRYISTVVFQFVKMVVMVSAVERNVIDARINHVQWKMATA